MKVRFRCAVIGVQMDDGTECVFVAGDEVRLSDTEMAQIDGRYVEQIKFIGEMNTAGVVTHCPHCRDLWRRRVAQKDEMKTCPDCANRKRTRILKAV